MSFLRLPTIGKKKRRQYNSNLLTLAYQEVRQKGISVSRAAKMFGVPESTLRDRTLGLQPVPEGETFASNPGPAPTFSKIEERQLVDHATYMAGIGYGYGRSEFLGLATDFAQSLKKKSNEDPPFAQSWYDSFKARNPELTLAKPQKLSMVRAQCTSERVLDTYFQGLEKVMDDHGLQNTPENIWNIDETGLMMELTPTNVICQKGTTPQAVTCSRGKTVTIIACGSAAGNRLPPYYVFPGKRWMDDLLTDACPGAIGTMTESGWSNSLVFMDYLERHFLKHVPTNGSPVLILFDGHKSHVNLTLTEWGTAHNILFHVLPPHTSHVTQPLDVGCFGPLKNCYYSECQSFLRKQPGVQINRYNIASISSRAYNKGLTPDNLISSFRKTGIFPLERNQIKQTKTAPSIIYQTETTQNNATETTHNNETETTQNNETDQLPVPTHSNFLDIRKITKVTLSGKKRKSHPSVHGNLMSPSKQTSLKKISIEMPAKSNSQKQKSKKIPIKKAVPSAKSTMQLSVESDDNSSIDDEIPMEELCCVCHKLSPVALNLAYTLEFAQWGQCDQCNHWTHLKYCSKVRCLRRNSTFLCPHCENES